MPQNLFAACRINKELKAKRVHLDRSVQQDIETIFRDQEADFRQDVTDEVDFDGDWKPEPNEFLTIDVPQEAQIFVDAINSNAVSIPSIDTKEFGQEGIKALFTGFSNNGSTKVLIQQFSSRQMLSNKFALVFQGNAFRRLVDQAFTLDTSLTCILEDGKLKFKSFHKMRSIIDLSDFYREATETEVRSFAKHPTFKVADVERFLSQSDQTIRKLIHSVTRMETLDNYSAKAIKEAAKDVKMDIAMKKRRIVMPESRAEVKILLHFLNDGLYEAPLSKQRYVTNSKKRYE